MRKHQLVAWGVLLVATALVGAAAAQAPSAAGKAPDHPGKAKARDGDKGEGEHGRPGQAKGDDAAGAADKTKDKLDDKDKDKPGHRHGHGAMHELFEQLKEGKVKKGEVKERLAKLHERFEERANEHRKELKERWGATLALPAVRQELEHHARRLARLNRALVLAETEVIKDKEKLVDRIQKLIEKENARHEAAMARFKSMPPSPAAPSAAAAAPAAPAASAKGGAQ